MTEQEDDRDGERLTQLLDALPDPQPSAALLRAVAEIPLRHPQPSWHPQHGFAEGAWWPFRSAGRLGLSLVLIALLGALTGLNVDDESSAYDAADDFGELSALGLAADLDQELAP